MKNTYLQIITIKSIISRYHDALRLLIPAEHYTHG